MTLTDKIQKEFAAALSSPDVLITNGAAMTKHGHDYSRPGDRRPKSRKDPHVI